MRAIIYCRVSSDPNQRSKSVDEQEKECRALATDRGWDIGEVLVDNDRGASRYSRKDRPAYRRLSKLLTDGDVLVTWEASRAQRDLKAYLQLRDLCAERGVMWCYSGRVYDLARGDDRFTTGLDALLSEKEVEQTRERVLRAVRANAAAGKPHGKLPYGYMIVRDPDTGEPLERTPNPTTAPILREIVSRILSGDSLYAVAGDLNDRGVPGPRPKRDGGPSPWIPVTLRKIIESPTYAGLRTHKGEVVGKATWEPLISLDEHERILAVLADPSRRSNHRGSEPHWLLSGIAVCGVCGSSMRRQKNRGYNTYVCAKGFCVARSVRSLDPYVTEHALRRLEGQDLLADLGSQDADMATAVAEVTALRQRLDAFTDSAAEGETSPTALARIESRLRPQIAAVEAKMRRHAKSPLVLDVAGPLARSRWETMAMRDRRDLLRELVTVEVVKLEKRQRTVPGPESVHFVWK